MEPKKYKSMIKKFKVVAEPTAFPKTKITASNDAYNVIKEFYSEDIEIYESFFILTLNQSHITTGYAKISQGGIAGTVVDATMLANFAISNLAKGVIIAHNHPSGNMNPSEQDRALTKRLKEGLKFLDTSLLDHLILSPYDNEFYSFADNGLI